MSPQKLLPIFAAVALAASPCVAAGISDTNELVTRAGVGTTGLLFAVEQNRIGIVNRLIADHAEELAANGIDEKSFRNGLMALRADQLLAASLVNTLSEVDKVVADPAGQYSIQEGFVAIAPASGYAFSDIPAADVYAVRDGDLLTLEKASQLQLDSPTARIVGYFKSAPSTGTVVLSAGDGNAIPSAGTQAPYASSSLTLKDGPGTGTNSWLGFLGGNNIASGTNSAVAAGSFNSASNLNSFIGAGQSNSANGISSVVVGGFDNHAVAIDSTIVGGAGNRSTGARSVVIGGGYNLVSGQWSFIGGGGRVDGSTPAGTTVQDHIVTGNWAGIASGIGNRVSGNYAFVGGGAYNSATNNGAVVVGGNNGLAGQGNTASGLNSFVGAGYLNAASGAYSAIFAGHENAASGNGAIILGGHGHSPGLGNVASGESSLVTTGYSNIASGNFASVISGHDSTASGLGSVAIGIQAKTEAIGPTVHDGAFVFSDGSSGNFRSTAPHTFNILATGGATVVTAATNTSGEAIATAGVSIAAGSGSWTSLSDRAAKKDIAAIDPQTVLARVASMPVYTWRYITEVSGALHMGPTAQDFRAAFGLGDSDRRITNVDADGVALAAIKGLKQELDAKNAEIATLREELDAIKQRLGMH
jgi:hypothetical protein